MKKQKQQGSITVFISYTQADHAVRDHLATHLSQLTRDGFIEAWSDQQILAGADRVQQIDLAIRRSSLILLLISAEFLASDACYDGEMQHALERHRAGEAVKADTIASRSKIGFPDKRCPKNTLLETPSSEHQLMVRRWVCEPVGLRGPHDQPDALSYGSCAH